MVSFETPDPHPPGMGSFRGNMEGGRAEEVGVRELEGRKVGGREEGGMMREEGGLR